MQKRCNSIAKAMKLRLFYIKQTMSYDSVVLGAIKSPH